MEYHKRGNVEAIAVFKDEKAADYLGQEMEKYSDEKNPELIVNTPDGQSFRVYVTWFGWLNDLEAVNITKTMLGKAEIDKSEKGFF